MATMMASGCRLLTGTTVEWRCEPDTDAQRIYFVNHSSHLDFVAIWSALPVRQRARTRPVAGRDYWDRNALRRYLAVGVFRAVLVNRRDTAGDGSPAAAARAAVEHIAAEMGDGDSLIVFPEGTRSANGDVGAFKSGLFHLSLLKPGAQLIPVYVENLNRILPKGEALPVPMLSRMVFGQPFRSASDDKATFLTGAREAMLALSVKA